MALDIRLVVCALAFPLTVSSLMPYTMLSFKTESRLVGWLQRNFLPFLSCGASLPYSCVIKRQSQQWTCVGVRCLDYIYGLFHLRKFAFPLSSSILSSEKRVHYFYFWASVIELLIELNNAWKPPNLVPGKSISMVLGNIWCMKRNENNLSFCCSLFRLLKDC